MRSKEAKLDEKAREIAGSHYQTNHVVELMDNSDLKRIETIGRLIASDAEFTINGDSKIGPLSEIGNAPSHGRVKTISYSQEKIKAQALRLQVIRRSHARRSVALIRTMGALVKRMKRLDAKVKREMAKALRTGGHEIDNIDEMGFEDDTTTFAWALEKVNEALDDAQAVADA